MDILPSNTKFSFNGNWIANHYQTGNLSLTFSVSAPSSLVSTLQNTFAATQGGTQNGGDSQALRRVNRRDAASIRRRPLSGMVEVRDERRCRGIEAGRGRIERRVLPRNLRARDRGELAETSLTPQSAWPLLTASRRSGGSATSA
jgi:hypothetical protein